ncbi:D-isomer specific 2-hydroxyacid dehydrogenase NAD-binding [Hydrogenobaculum sp. Y04AAS1]|uniref:NAD(P)-dependent oxidoreductase n=1 Tax=Hydrogenobaculum sp. (strain Y04AAS1) TaxID=380749 RepID=UPI00015BD3AA|nr:D-isomer specific 2-hydroxyacid dehydrogenase NAD-binding [Hydrogenobaculum sp. Y04AAS1]HCT66704.1 hydroxyacid dehydrogenase [Hydrogenobaculum sp.]
MKIAFCELESWEMPYIENFVEENNLELVCFSNETIDKVEIPDDIEILSVFIYSKISKDVIDSLPDLKLIATRSTGFDHIDVAYANSKGITVCNVPSYGEESVSEYAIMLMLALARKLRETIDNVEKGVYKTSNLRGIELAGKTLGVIGTGRIGARTALLARCFGMDVVCYDARQNQILIDAGIKYLDFNELLSVSDFITLHVPYLPSTHHLINMDNIKLFKKGSFLINTSRGKVVETESVIYGLKQKILAGAAIDTFESEEVVMEEHLLWNENLSAETLKKALEINYLLKHPNVIITPHNAYNTKEGLQRILNTTFENIQSFLKNQAKNVVK